MEIAARPQPLEPPLAELVGIQFGLTTAKDVVRFSVLEAGTTGNAGKDLLDSRLGLPSEDDRCSTCGGTNYDECSGHFAHVKLTQPIFHPNHMRLLQRMLEKICLGCGRLKKKKKKTIEDIFKSSEDGMKRRIKSRGLDGTLDQTENGLFDAPHTDLTERPGDGGGVIFLSSDDEGCTIPRDILRVVQPARPPTGSAYKGKAHSNGSSLPEITSNRNSKAKSGSMRGRKRSHKGSAAEVDMLYADTIETALPTKSSTCPHCSAGNPEYPPISVKILPVKGKKKDDVSQILQMEIELSEKKPFDLAYDFWAFIEGATKEYEIDAEVPHKRILLPSEALKLLKRIPEESIGKLGMNSIVARPEALIMQCVPVPPNCTRTTDYKYVNNTSFVRFGTDKVTKSLLNLTTEIVRIKGTRTGKAMLRARRDESKILQILTAEYLREKGAPKAVPGKEPLKKDRNGRITKQDDRRWTKEWLTQNILGKGGNYNARAVVVGDPSLGVGEIGVPREISQRLSIPERANTWNCSKLQKFIDRTQTLDLSEGPGAIRIVRGGEAFQVWSNSTHKVEIGDVVHRHVQDGDYVYVNRPPSVHKHSLMALRVNVINGLVLTVNPIICPPFNADFDGDIFHIFVPQSLEAMAELEQLMAVEHQVVSDQGGHPLLGLTQDLLLAAHLITSTKVLLDKDTINQLCMWTSRDVPEAAIIKSPKGGPFWTGEQVFGLTLPSKFNIGSADSALLIKGGDILKWNGDAKLLHKGRESITGALCEQLGPKALVDYLNSAKGLLHAWLHLRGFSTGLTDFLVSSNSATRQEMLRSVFDDYFLKAIQESCDTVQILDANPPLDVEVDDSTGQAVISAASLTKKVRLLEQAAPTIFRARAVDAEKLVLRIAEEGNALLAMVKSGSKGSVTKVLQQIAGLGLQLYKGQYLLPFSRKQPHAMSDSPLLDWWEDHGFVRSSFLDGLNAFELFNHVVADRTGILRKHVEVVQPGTLFKSLMLFLRDLHVMYDGSVRSQSGQALVQFCYGGAVGIPKRTLSDKDVGWNDSEMGEDLGVDISTQTGGSGETITWEEDVDRRWQLSGLAGEPVGVLAATAVAQPAYELMLDAPNLNGPFQPRPLELVQETLYPRDSSGLKPVDRCALIRLVKCQCTEPMCLEKRILEVQAHLKRITLKTVAQSTAIEFWNMDDFEVAGPSGEALRLGSPWLGHIQLSQEMMHRHQLTVEEIVDRLRMKYSGKVKVTKKTPLGKIFFCFSEFCEMTKGLCLHFSPKLPTKMQNQSDDDLYSRVFLELLEKIQASMIPGLLDSTIKGYEQMESVKIISEGPTWSTWHRETAYDQGHGEELVLEVVAAPEGTKRNMAWNLVKEACLPIMHMVDWSRSMPYSIQEIRQALGVEAAYEMVARRLCLVLEKTAPHIDHVHVKLIADMMTFSGDANGFTLPGFRDMIKSAGISAPFAVASFQKPIRTLLDAAVKGASDPLEGVMTSCVWGKEAPVGTGINVDILWQAQKEPQGNFAARSKEARDVHLIWKDLHEKCIPDAVIPPSPARELPDLQKTSRDNAEFDDYQSGFSPQQSPIGNDEDDPDDNWAGLEISGSGGQKWGDSPKANDDDVGGWNDTAKTITASKGTDQGGWDSLDKPTEYCADGWGDKDTVSKKKTTSGDGWESIAKESGQGGWDNVAAETKSGGGWGEDNGGAAENGWGAVGECEKENDSWTGTGNKKSNGQNQNGWGSNTEEKVDGDGWDTIAAEPDRKRKSTNEASAGSGWGAVSEQEKKNEGWSGAGNKKSNGNDQNGWGSNTEEKVDGDGWDTIAAEPDQKSKSTNQASAGSGWGAVHEQEKKKEGWSGSDNNKKSNNGNNQNGWGSNMEEKVDGDGWDTIAAEPDEKGRSTNKASAGGGWDSVPTTDGEPGGWDSFTEPKIGKTSNAMEDSGRGAKDVGPGTGYPGNKDFRSTSEDRSGHANTFKGSKGFGNDRGWTPQGRGRGRGAFDRDRDRGRQGGWGSDSVKPTEDSGWGNKDEAQVDRTQNHTGWGENDETKTSGQARNQSGDWDVKPVEEGGGGGWDNVTTIADTTNDGWGSLDNDKTTRATEDSGWEKRDGENNCSAERESRPGYGNRKGYGDSYRISENFGNDRGWTPRGRGRGRGGRDRDRDGEGGLPGSGANSLPLGKQRQFGSWQVPPSSKPANARTEDTSSQQEGGQVSKLLGTPGWGGSQSLPTDNVAGVASGWDDLETCTNTTVQEKGNWSQPANEKSGGWGTVAGEQALDDQAADGWDAVDTAPEETETDNWGITEEIGTSNRDAGSRPPRTRPLGFGANPRPPRLEIEPEYKEIDQLVKSMRFILFNPNYSAGTRLPDEDDTTVQSLLAYHPKFLEKVGCGVAYIKIDKSPFVKDKESRCFWLVRIDGSETDFSFHKCVKEKVAREFPSFVDRYDGLYLPKRGDRGPPTNVTKGAETEAKKDE